LSEPTMPIFLMECLPSARWSDAGSHRPDASI